VIKFIGKRKSNGHTVVGLGLSRRNCELLLQDKPIEVDVSKMRPELAITILIVGGENEQAIRDTLDPDRETPVHEMPPGDANPQEAMSTEEFNRLLNGPLSHPLVPFTITRLSLALAAVVEATGKRGAEALRSHCAARDARDNREAREGEGQEDLN